MELDYVTKKVQNSCSCQDQIHYLVHNEGFLPEGISSNENLTASSWICYILTVMEPQNFRLWKQILVRSIPHQRQMRKSLWRSLYKGSHDAQHWVSRCLLYPFLNQCSVTVSPYPIPSSSDILQCPWHTHSFSHIIIPCAFNYNLTSNMAFWIIPCSQS